MIPPGIESRLAAENGTFEFLRGSNSPTAGRMGQATGLTVMTRIVGVREHCYSDGRHAFTAMVH